MNNAVKEENYLWIQERDNAHADRIKSLEILMNEKVKKREKRTKKSYMEKEKKGR